VITEAHAATDPPRPVGVDLGVRLLRSYPRRGVSAPAPVNSEKQNGPRSRKGAETRARLLDAAKQIFEEHGFLDARISDIAQRAQLSHGSFYHYFDSKEQIFREVAQVVDERLSAPLESVIFDTGSHATPQERVGEAMRRHLESYRAEARIIGVIEQVARYDDHVRALRTARQQHYVDQIAASIRHLQRRGMVDPELDPAIAVAALGAMTSRFPEMWLVEGTVDCTFDEGVDQLTRLFLNALRLSDSSIN
jgi:AcrR family transcriptional regulator